MGVSKEMLIEEEKHLAFATSYAIKHGILRRCLVHEEVYDTLACEATSESLGAKIFSDEHVHIPLFNAVIRVMQDCAGGCCPSCKADSYE